ncbi:hypothetical protein V8B97DRAFT_1865727 [Scleroderma yunnanense]
MLQYSAQPIPLPLQHKPIRKDNITSHNDSSRIFNKRFTKGLNLTNSSPSIAVPALPSPSPAPSPLPASAILSPKSASPMSIPSLLPASSSIRHLLPPSRPTTTRQSSFGSSIVEDVLALGDIIGPGLPLQGHLIRPASTSTQLHDNSPGIASEFEVIRKLGTGSYAVVYLVREVLSRTTPSEDGHCGTLDLGDTPNKSYVSYGREFALKCLSKANLDEDALAAQLSEVTIHQSLRPHPNIVTLHRTFETPAFLLLLLEYVPGEDLFFFLEQARDHYEPTPLIDDSVPSRTPPTPSLLASLHPAQLLSQTRLRLIARMLTQMCDAVAACHEQGVFHRDIKPENFIVTDAFVNGERRVVVKLTDFGLSTTDEDCSDIDCGSAPYMSFECRNYFAPTYKPAAADVWSLGIVLINMLYHCNPWTDTAKGRCPSFSLFMQQGAHFFMHRFTGMTSTVADFLASRVFTLPSSSLPSSTSPSPPVTAREFAEWVKDLPAHFDVLLGSPLGLGAPKALGHIRVLSTSSTRFGHPLSSCPPSRRPSSRAGLRTPILNSRSLSMSRAPSVSASVVGRGIGALETVVDVGDMSVEESEVVLRDISNTLQHTEAGIDADIDGESGPLKEGEQELEDGRSRSTKKRGRRGARKTKASTTVDDDKDKTLHDLAIASQSLAREISEASRSSSLATPAAEPVSSALTPTPVVKKASIWKLPFSKGGSHTASAGDEPAPGTASNVSNLIMGLAAPPSAAVAGSTSHHQSTASLHSSSAHPSHPNHGVSSPYTRTPLTPQRSPADEATIWTRGRRPQGQAQPYNPNTWGPSLTNHGGHGGQPGGASPQGVRNGLYGASGQGINSMSASSTTSITSSSTKSNWRSSVVSAASTSTSGFTRYSNSSTRSVSTVATSVSNGSWRSPPTSNGSCAKQSGVGAKEVADGQTQNLPKNVKILYGVPWELDQLPRQLHPNPEGDIFGQPPQRKRTRKPKDSSKLDTISERPSGSTVSSPLSKSNVSGLGVIHQRQDAATSTTDLGGITRGNDAADSSASIANMGGNDGTTPKKVQKGQIHALAKMLSALRR